MASFSILESAGERREQWQRLERYYHDRLEEAQGNHRATHSSVEVRTLQSLWDYLRDFRVSDSGHHPPSDVLDRLSPALLALEPFAKTIELASQHPPVSTLIWSGFLSGFQAASPDKSVSLKTVHLMIELSKCVPQLPEFSSKVYQLRAVQYALQDLFEDYLEFCVQLSQDFGSSRTTLGMTKSRIARHYNKLHDAAKSELQLLREQQEAEIARLIPSGMVEPPKDIDVAPSEISVEFPVNTVNKARNSAFVGREDLLEQIASRLKGGKDHTGARATTSLARHGSQSLIHLAPESPSPRAAQAQSLSSSSSSRAQPDSVSTNDSRASSETSPIICVLHGVGGIGKTQVALEYYYEHRDEYDGCFWMEAERDWTLASSFARIADKLSLLRQKTMDDGGHEVQNKAIEHARKWLQTTPHHWLLIFDNVEDFGDLARYLPTERRATAASIIITTQSPTMPAWFENTYIVPVKALTPETGAACLFSYLDRPAEDEEEHELACQLAEHVGCLPLVMATIGGYVRQSQMSLSEFFENIKHKATLWEKAPKVQDTLPYERSLIDVFSKAFEDLTPAARELLNVLAFLDPDSVPEELFTNAIQENYFEKIKSKNDLLDCYFELRSRQLIRRDTSSKDPYISIHRTVQWNTLLDLSSDYEKRWESFRKAFNIVQYMLPKTSPLDIPEPEVWPPYAKHGRQILELRTHCLWPEPPVELPKEFAQILADMGTYMWFSGKFPEGEDALDTAENILDDNKAKINDPLRAKIYLMLGILTSFEGVSERQRSMDFRRRGAFSRSQDLGRKPKAELSREEDILLWNAHSDMAFGFIQQEDMEQTRQYMEDCFERYQIWDKNEMAIPYEYAKYYQLVSHCHMADQDPVKAIEAITRCYELMQSAAGNDHPMTHLISFCHANLLWHTTSALAREKALRIHKAVLQHRQRILGEFSHFTLESYSTCGKLCHDANENEEARHYLATCLQRRKRAVWNEEGVTRAQHRYSNVLRALAEKVSTDGDEEKALEYNQLAEKLEGEVIKTIAKYRERYADLLPPGDDSEENLDQMVSFWAGRFTGKLKQDNINIGIFGLERMTSEQPVHNEILNTATHGVVATEGERSNGEQNGLPAAQHQAKKRRLQ